VQTVRSASIARRRHTRRGLSVRGSVEGSALGCRPSPAKQTDYLNVTTRVKPLALHRGMSILVLEDDDLSRDVARSILRGAGFEVVCARHFQEAIDHVQSDAKMDIALVDVQMPSGTPSGISFVRLAQNRRPSMKIIFMSAHVGSQDFVRFAEGEVLLLKPFAPHQLLEFVKRAGLVSTLPRVPSEPRRRTDRAAFHRRARADRRTSGRA
jgi:CheY-like chemotaxis protein